MYLIVEKNVHQSEKFVDLLEFEYIYRKLYTDLKSKRKRNIDQ